MKKLLILFSFSLFIGSLSAQQNSISIEQSFFNNGNKFSGIGISYFKSITSKHALGIRPSIKFNNKENSRNNFSWQVDFLSKIQTSANEKTKTHIEFGGAFLNRMDRAIHPLAGPEICFVALDDVNTKYLGFVLGASIEKRLGEHFNIGLAYRTNLFFNIKEVPQRDSIFISNPLASLSYTF